MWEVPLVLHVPEVTYEVFLGPKDLSEGEWNQEIGAYLLYEATNLQYPCSENIYMYEV